jgi:membrane protease subunit (stomatin/prohibitin family)
MPNLKQTDLFKGIYEFEDPSGTLLAAKVPSSGSVDLFDGTVLVVRPNQCCVFVYKGEVAELYADGTHELRTKNLPVLTRLANWRHGGRSPLRAELWFFSGQLFSGRRWGTAQPILVPLAGQGTVPLRAFGQYNIAIKDPLQFFRTLVGTRSAFDITELEDLVQGQIQELIPQALKEVKSIEDLSAAQEKVSKTLEKLLDDKLKGFGLKVVELQVMSLSPGEELIKAMDAKAAMNAIGDPKAYLLYQAAQSLQGGGAGGDERANDPMQMMLGLMLGKNMMGEGEAAKASRPQAPERLPTAAGAKFCGACGAGASLAQKFCGACGGKL